MPSDIRYVCENDACPAAGEEHDIARGAEAVCPSCGWIMSGRKA